MRAHRLPQFMHHPNLLMEMAPEIHKKPRLEPLASDFHLGSGDTKKRWATTSDWVQHKDTIIRLYKGNCRRLDDVRRTMEREHNFHASAKMYKDRLRKWGVRKNAPAALSAPLKRHTQQQPGGEPRPSSPSMKKTIVTHETCCAACYYGSDNSYYRRRCHGCHAEARVDPHHDISPRADDALIAFVRTDLDGPQAFQAALCALEEHTARVFGRQTAPAIWAHVRPSHIYSHDMVDWLARLTTAARLVRKGMRMEGKQAADGSGSQNTAVTTRGFSLLSHCLDELLSHRDLQPGASASASSSTAILSDIMLGAQVVSTVSPELYASFLRYVERLAAMRLGSARDPIARLAGALLRLGWDDHRTYGFGLGTIHLLMYGRYAPGEGFTAAHRAAALRVQGWLLMSCYADDRALDSLDEDDEEEEEAKESGEDDGEQQGEQAVNGGLHEAMMRRKKNEEREKREKLRMSPDDKLQDPSWRTRESMWKDCAAETDGLMRRQTVYQKVRRQGGVKYLTFMDDDYDEGG